MATVEGSSLGGGRAPGETLSSETFCCFPRVLQKFSFHTFFSVRWKYLNIFVWRWEMYSQGRSQSLPHWYLHPEHRNAESFWLPPLHQRGQKTAHLYHISRCNHAIWLLLKIRSIYGREINSSNFHCWIYCFYVRLCTGLQLTENRHSKSFHTYRKKVFSHAIKSEPNISSSGKEAVISSQ